MNRITHIQSMKANGEKIAALTAYDASFAQVFDQSGVDIILVGDSVGMVVQGHTDVINVSLEDIAYHTRLVRRGCERPLIMSDMPFLSCNTPQEALTNAGKLIKAGAAMVKIEGSEWLGDTIELLTERGILVCAHIGLTAQMVHTMGGYIVQGKNEAQAAKLIHDAKTLQARGAAMILLECVPTGVGEQLSSAVDIPVIGIGAGPFCDGQILVSYDALGLGHGKPYKFVRNFMADQTNGISGAVSDYVQNVKSGSFPNQDECFA